MAQEALRYPEDSKGLIHHSDRGCQYCSYSYVDKLKSRGMQISMTESGDPLENAVAERELTGSSKVNGFTGWKSKIMPIAMNEYHKRLRHTTTSDLT